MSSLPAVSVILPVLNEKDSLDECLASLAAQDYQGEVEIVVAEGGSTDGTRERLAAWQGRVRLRLIENLDRNQAEGLNRAAAAAAYPILVRADAHTTYAADYVRASLASLLSSNAVAVGGRQTPVGTSRVGIAVAAAMNSPFAVGPAPFRSAVTRQPADTVYLGTFRKQDFLAIGGYQRLPSGVAEDADLYFRWRKAGHMVLLDPAIRSTYLPRQRWDGLAKQFFRYGRGKAEMAWRHRRLPSWRPLAPLALILALIVTSLFIARTAVPLVVLLGLWLAPVGWVAARSRTSWWRVALAIVIIHLGYGLGLWWGLLTGWRR